jgi:hypothetical protein
MRTINVLNAYAVPTMRKSGDDAPQTNGNFLTVSSASGYGDSYVTVEVGDKLCTVLGSQFRPAVQNANNCVRGCMQVICDLNTFDEIPKNYEERQKPRISSVKLFIKSTSRAGFVRIELVESVRIVRHEELLAAIDNATKR